MCSLISVRQQQRAVPLPSQTLPGTLPWWLGGASPHWDRDPSNACLSSLRLDLSSDFTVQWPCPGSLHPEPGGAPRLRMGSLWVLQSEGHMQAAPALIPSDSSTNHLCPKRQQAQQEEKKSHIREDFQVVDDGRCRGPR